MSPETEARIRAWAKRTRAAIAAGEIACPGDGQLCEQHVEKFGNHLHNCPREAAVKELTRIERELKDAAAEHFARPWPRRGATE